MDIDDIKVKEEIPDVEQEVPDQIYDDVFVKEESTIQEVKQSVQRKTTTEDESVYFEITEIIPNLDANGKKHICTNCGKAFGKACDLKRHMISHSNERNHRCHKCSLTFKHRRSLAKHLKTHGSQSVSPISCQICNKIIKHAANLQRHMRLQHDTIKIRYKCIHCGKMFSDKPALKMHIRRFHDEHRLIKEEEPLICPECGKSYSVRHQNHYERHVKAKKCCLKCSICLRKYANRTSLTTHIKTHSTERSFACDKCDKTFKLMKYLKIHQDKHCTTSDRTC